MARLALRCSLAAAVVATLASAASVHLRASATTGVAGRSASKDYGAGSACQFVAHRPDNTEAVLAAGGPHVLFRQGSVAVVEDKPTRYLVSLADDGTCNEQAEQLCSFASTSNSSTSCEETPCVPEGNGDTLLSYLRSMVGGALAFRPPPSRSAVIGLGSGALAFWLGRAFPDASVDAVDLSGDVIAAAKCFGLQSSEQVRIIEDEGRHFLVGAKAFTYDAIFLDAFDASGSLPGCLATSEFFELVAQKLTPDQGVLSVNLGAKDPPGPMLAAIQKAFMHVAVGRAPQLTNHLVLASQTEIAIQAGESGSAEILSPGTVAANLTRWARQGTYHLGKSEAIDAGGVAEVPRTDAGEGCSVTPVAN